MMMWRVKRNLFKLIVFFDQWSCFQLYLADFIYFILLISNSPISNPPTYIRHDYWVILCGLSFYGTIYVSVNYFVITSVVLSAQSFLLLILNKNYEYHAILNQIYFQLNHVLNLFWNRFARKVVSAQKYLFRYKTSFLLRYS